MLFVEDADPPGAAEVCRKFDKVDFVGYSAVPFPLRILAGTREAPDGSLLGPPGYIIVYV